MEKAKEILLNRKLNKLTARTAFYLLYFTSFYNTDKGADSNHMVASLQKNKCKIHGLQVSNEWIFFIIFFLLSKKISHEKMFKTC